MNGHGKVAGVCGDELPAVSISWCEPVDPRDSGFMVLFSDFIDEMEARPVCLHCLVDEGDEDLGRGLDLARKYGHVDFDVQMCEWFVPEDRQFPDELGWDATV